MFGSPTLFVKGNMFDGVHEDTIIIRLSETDLKEVFTLFKDVKPLTPMGGHVMKEYAVVTESFTNHPIILKQFSDRSYKYASSLPPKPAKRPLAKR
jgi:TfoX/Sxy family transcriptional regulator of competence genes